MVSATQGGKSIPATLVAVDGGRFALVKVVPDKGEVSIVSVLNGKTTTTDEFHPDSS